MISIATTSREHGQDIARALESLSGDDFRLFGLGNLAYIRPVTVDGVERQAICGADGTPLSVVDSADEARKLLSRNEMSTGTSALH